MSREMLTVADIEKMLLRLFDAIEHDQIYVDGLPRDRFHHAYDDTLWRNWRQGHREFIAKLLATTDTVSAPHLQRLTEVASGFAPEVAGYVMLETFADVVSGSSDCETAGYFFEWVAGEVVRQDRGKRRNQSARKAMMQWFPLIDPLQIARDPECGYPTDARARQDASRPAP
jgi:hypothetical protein